MSEIRHTPTPWKFVPWHIEEGPSAVRAPEGWLICCTSSDGNAEIIAKAVNAYADNQALIRDLVEVIERFCNIMHHCNVTDGMCCCGDDMERHSNPMDCGHSPVDHGSYVAEQVLKSAVAALSRAREAGFGGGV